MQDRVCQLSQHAYCNPNNITFQNRSKQTLNVQVQELPMLEPLVKATLLRPCSFWEREREKGPKKSSNEKTPCWPYRHPVMLVDSALRQQWYRNMAVSIVRRPVANAVMLILTFLATLLFHRSFADIAAGASTSEETPHRRFEYKYSFKGPHLAQTDGSIPFWIHTGSKFVSSCQHHTAAGHIFS